MEISPRELRDIEIREAFRGYQRDDVNELLERAAVTIEALTDRVRELGDRVASGTGSPTATNRNRDLEEMLERTLLLAKRTADEEVAEATAKARQLVDDAEAKARKLVLDAEVDARRRSEEEHGRIQRELIDLGERRDTLSVAVEELDRFESEYRERLFRSIEADLAVIGGRGSQAPGSAPDVPEVAIPALPEAIHTPSETTSADSDASDAAGAVEEVGAAESPLDAQAMLEAAAAKATARHEAERRTRDDEQPTAAYDALADDDPATEEDLESGQIDLLDEEAVEAEVVDDDDDEFFAQLRDAVSDDQPLTEQETTFFDQENDRRERELFRRRS